MNNHFIKDTEFILQDVLLNWLCEHLIASECVCMYIIYYICHYRDYNIILKSE